MNAKDKILEVAFDLITDKGIQNVSMKEIVEKSGVSNGTLYHHFPSKDKIVEQLYSNIAKEIMLELKENIQENMYFREFLWISWELTIRFYTMYPLKYNFMKSFKDSIIVKNCKLEGELLGIQFSRFDDAVEKEIIDVPSIEYFDIMYSATIYGVMDYLVMTNLGSDKDLIKCLFNKFWRSVVKL